MVIDPVGGDLAEPALRSLHYGGRFVTVGYAAGAIPRIPLNLVLLKGIHILGFQFRDFAMHQPADMARNDRELLELLAEGRAAPLIGAEFDLADVVAALRHVADGQGGGQGAAAGGAPGLRPGGPRGRPPGHEAIVDVDVSFRGSSRRRARSRAGRTEGGFR